MLTVLESGSHFPESIVEAIYLCSVHLPALHLSDRALVFSLLQSLLPAAPHTQNMLHQLYTKGPFTVGIFRKSANARLCREIAARLEADPEYCLDEVPIAVVGSVFKDFLRSLPNCLLDSRLLNKWIEALSPEHSEEEQRQAVEKLLKKIPAENLLLLKHVLCLLWHIAQHSSVNKMCPSNLAVCIGPSLLSSSKIISPVRREVSPVHDFNFCRCSVREEKQEEEEGAHSIALPLFLSG